VSNWHVRIVSNQLKDQQPEKKVSYVDNSSQSVSLQLNYIDGVTVVNFLGFVMSGKLI